MMWSYSAWFGRRKHQLTHSKEKDHIHMANALCLSTAFLHQSSTEGNFHLSFVQGGCREPPDPAESDRRGQAEWLLQGFPSTAAAGPSGTTSCTGKPRQWSEPTKPSHSPLLPYEFPTAPNDHTHLPESFLTLDLSPVILVTPKVMVDSRSDMGDIQWDFRADQLLRYSDHQ